MSALLEANRPTEPTDLYARLGERVADWQDPADVGQAVADVLGDLLVRPAITVFRCDPTGDLRLLGSHGGRGEAIAIGTRTPADGALGNALRDRVSQKNLNKYVEPDFVHSLPGEQHSVLAVPVVVGSDALGVIQLDYASPASPTAEDQKRTEELASYLAVAWRAASVDGPVANPSAEGDRLDVEALVESLARSDFDTLLQRVPEAAIELLGCDGAAVLMRHSERQMLEVASGSGVLGTTAGALIPLDGTGAGGVFRSGKSASVVGGAWNSERILPEEVLPGSIGAALMVPVLSNGKIDGLLIAIRSNSDRRFDHRAAPLLETLGNVAGAAIAIRSIGPLRQRISDAALIAEVGRAMTGTLGIDDVLAVVVRSAEMLISGRSAGVVLRSGRGNGLVLAAASGSLMLKTGTELSSDTILGHVIASGETTLTENLSEDERGWPFGDNYGPAALFALESRNETRGVLFAARNAKGEPLSDKDIDALRKLGAYAAIAIENAKLYQEQTELSSALRKQTDELEMAYAELRTSQERLLVSEKMAALGRVTAGIAHEINSPLGSILNCLQLATSYAEEYGESVGDPEVTLDDHRGIAKDILESLKLAEDSARRVAQFVRTIKGQTRMEDEKDEPFDPSEVVDSTLVILGHEFENKPIDLEADLDRSVELRGDATKFAQIIQNLVSNAADAYEGEPGKVRISLRSEDGNAILEVADDGCGIPEEIRPRIFDYLFTTKDVGSGTGLGLAMVHSTVASHFHGKVDFRTEVGSGTTFVVTIPLRPEN